MRAVLHGRDLPAVMPTGSGKSAIYQIPSLPTGGVTLVVSPLLALQQDQIAAIEESGAGRAVAVDSTLRAAQRRRNGQSIESGSADFVFVPAE